MLNAEGKIVRISDLIGELTLLHFWSPTCGFSREMNRSTLTEIYPKYHPQGFEIVTVSDDPNREAWLSAIQEDEMNWPQANNLQSADEEVFKAYGVNSTPSNFLVNSEGVIVAKNLQGDELKRKIEEELAN